MVNYLIYLSAATHLFSEQELADLLTVSRKNNAESNVTGILLYHKGNILQVLEGEKKTVHSLYEKISSDARHRNVIVLVRGESPERSFPDWSMGFRSLKPDEWSIYEGYIQLQQSTLYSVIKIKNSRIDTSLKSFAKIHAL